MPGPCPTPERLAAALRGRQPGGGDAELAAHLNDCPACQAQLEALAGGSGWLKAKARTHTATVSTAPESLRQAMSALESQSGISEHEAPPPPKLDFLQLVDQPGVLGRFGPYEVSGHVASGGMGMVLKARDPALNRVVALKILPPALAANSLARARFVREARTAAAVVHEHVVPIYAVDEFAGLPYIVMQFVHGRSLSERIRATGPLRLEEILRVGAQTAAGLAAAHAQGLIHRDIKPGNILLENSVERVKLTDFGLARAGDDTGLTRTGELAGTPEFMAPEQAKNEAVDHRADLFSFGSVLYAMCTGGSPFQASSVIAAVRKVCDEQPPPVREVNTAIPRWLSDIIAKLMAKSPADRFQSAREVSELLERYLARVQRGDLDEISETSHARPATGRARQRIAIGAVACLPVIALLVFLLKHQNSSPSSSQPVTSLQASFLVREAGAANAQSFPTLAAAISASGSEAVIEVGGNGPFEVEPSVVDHPLILRSAVGCRPVLVRRDVTRPILLARAPLVIEGLTFQDGETAAQEDDAPAVSRKAGGPRGPMIRKKEFIFVEGTALFLANCRLIMLGPAGPRLPAVQLQGALRCEFQNCELFTPDTAAVNVKTASGRAGKPRYAIVLRNCIWFAQRALVGEFSRAEEGTMDLERNTFAGEAVFNWSVLPAGKLVVTANSNLFDVETMMSRGLPPRMGSVAPPRPNASPVSENISWREQGNFYSVRKFSIMSLDGSQSEPELKDLTAWLKYWQATGTSRTGKALVASKVKARQSDPDKLSPNDFRLEGIRADDGGIVSGVGTDVELVGPGANYDRWRATLAYAEWTQLIKAALASQ